MAAKKKEPASKAQGRGEGCFFYLFILHCWCRVSSRGRWKGGGVQWGPFQSKTVFWTERRVSRHFDRKCL